MSELSADIQVLRESFGRLPEPIARPLLIIVSGLPGTGKSYFCRKLAEHLPCVILESDALRKKLFVHPVYNSEESKRLFSACYGLIEELLQGGHNVILDATNLIEQNRKPLYIIVKNYRPGCC